MKKSLFLSLLFIGGIALAWCQKTEWEPEVAESKYPVAEQVCVDNGWIVTVDDEGTPICLLWDRGINLADMEEQPEIEAQNEENSDEEISDEDNIDVVLPEWAKTSLTNEELDKIAETNFPKGYHYSTFNTTENIKWDEWEYTYPEDLSHTLLIPEHATMASREVTSSGIEDGMIYTLTRITLQDDTEIEVLYINDPVTLNFVAVSSMNSGVSTLYQFNY